MSQTTSLSPGDFLLNVRLEVVNAKDGLIVVAELKHAPAVYEAGSKLESPEEMAVVTARAMPVASAKHALFADLMV